jgi:hypothetical protein
MKYSIFDSSYYQSIPDTKFKQTWTVLPNEPIEVKRHRASPQVGEVWYYKLKSAVSLGCGKVTDVTDHTVEVGGLQHWSLLQRYSRADIEFVEKRQ